MATDVKINLKIYWIRHGYSCANQIYNKKYDMKNIDKDKIAPDAKLTDITLNKICEMKKDMSYEKSKYYCVANSDFILCSELTRAIETAMMLFGTFNKQIFVVPYVGEIVNSSELGKTDNIPSDNEMKLINIRNIIKFHNDKRDICGGPFNSTVSLDILNEIKKNHKLNNPNLDKFLKYVIPELLKIKKWINQIM